MAILTVHSFEELIAAEFAGDMNAICWQRHPEGDFDEVAACFAGLDEVSSLDDEDLAALQPRLSTAGRRAIEAMIEDRQRMAALGLSPNLECVPVYARDDDPILPTDVYSFHADRATVKADTYLCSYNEAPSEGLRNEDAIRRIDQPDTRARLLAAFAQEGGDDFDGFLREHCYDLHYAPRAGAVPFSFGLGNLWRIAVDYPGSPVPPCIHRAPATVAGRPPRLLLIS